MVDNEPQELNREVVIKDISEIMEHMNNMNKEMQKVYIKFSNIIRRIIIETNDESS